MKFCKDCKWYAGGLILAGVVIGIILVSVGTAAFHWAGSEQFCGTFCHSMDTVYAAYQKGLHGQTKSGFKVGCSDCHLKYESEHSISQAQVVGMIWHKFTSAMVSGWGEVRGTLNTKEKQAALREELGKRYIAWAQSTNFANCRGCHDVSNFKPDPAKEAVAEMHKVMALPGAEVNCIICHKTAGHDYGAIGLK